MSSDDTRLGPELRALRHGRRLSLAEVSAATGISPSFLSLIENGKSDITLGRLVRLVRFYGVSISDLIPDPDASDPVVVRRGTGRHIHSPAEGIDVFLLTHDTRQAMLPVLAIYEPGGRTEELANPPGGEQFVFVVEGSVEIQFHKGDAVELGPGDAAYFKTDAVRSYSVMGDSSAQVLGVVTPPAL